MFNIPIDGTLYFLCSNLYYTHWSFQFLFRIDFIRIFMLDVFLS